MAAITASMVKDLRETTGAGMMDCKAALTETNGDVQAAVDWLRKKGLSKAAKKAGRDANSYSATNSFALAIQLATRVGRPTSSPIFSASASPSSASCE